jgi:putative membrane protein
MKQIERAEELDLDRSTSLAYDRTWLAEERTVLAWVRTAISFITFGFAIYSFFGISSGAGYKFATYLGPRIFSLSLIAVGLFALVAATIQRRRAIEVMRRVRPDLPHTSAAGIVGGLVACLGLLALVVLLWRF